MKKSLGILATLLLGTALPAAAVFGHHSFQASYDMDSLIEIKGTLMQLNFRNPHSSVMVMAPDADGNMQRWGIEWGGASLLMRQGLTRDSFKVGDEVVITGQPGRDAGPPHAHADHPAHLRWFRLGQQRRRVLRLDVALLLRQPSYSLATQSPGAHLEPSGSFLKFVLVNTLWLR
jgi:hypothetical protein